MKFVFLILLMGTSAYAQSWSPDLLMEDWAKARAKKDQEEFNKKMEQLEKRPLTSKQNAIITPLWKIYQKDKVGLQEVANFFDNEEEAVYCNKKLNLKAAETPVDSAYYLGYWNGVNYKKEVEKTYLRPADTMVYYYEFAGDAGLWKVYKQDFAKKNTRHIADFPVSKEKLVKACIDLLNQKK